MSTQRQRVAVVGGGIAGLTAALRLAEQGFKVDLFEAAPALGGRTKSFYDENLKSWVDNGPHLMVGAYTATQKLLADVDAGHFVTWQPSLCLPLWDKQRGFFELKASAWLPVSLALLWAVFKMPGHGWPSVKAMLKIALTMHNRDEKQTVADWFAEIAVPDILLQDMLNVLCLGVMNEPMQTANAKTFARVLATSFSSQRNARMGWFNKPLSQALIEPVAKRLRELGVCLELRHTVRNLSELNHDIVVLALPAFARNRLLGVETEVETQMITNIHLWFAQHIALPTVMLGMLGTYSQWLFNVSKMMTEEGLQHLCVTVSADISEQAQDECVNLVLAEIENMIGQKLPYPEKTRLVREKRATVLVREQQYVDLPQHVFDVGESPEPGQLPATIELAVISAEKISGLVIKGTKINA